MPDWVAMDRCVRRMFEKERAEDMTRLKVGTRVFSPRDRDWGLVTNVDDDTVIIVGGLKIKLVVRKKDLVPAFRDKRFSTLELFEFLTGMGVTREAMLDTFVRINEPTGSDC